MTTNPLEGDRKMKSRFTAPPRGAIVAYLVQYTTGDGYYVLMPGQQDHTLFAAREYLKDCRKRYPEAAKVKGSFRIQAYMPESIS